MNSRLRTYSTRIVWPCVGRAASLVGVCAMVVFSIGSMGDARAQNPYYVPENAEAQVLFEQGLQAFQAGDYGMAYRRFRLVDQSLPLNRHTTASRLMAGKSLYRSGQYAEAISVLGEFLRQFPFSSYVDEARETMQLAREALEGAREHVEPLALGIALPLSQSDAALTQALFNGVRMAVDEHNATHGAARPVRMVFRDTEGTRPGARDAMNALVDRDRVGAVIGPLFSEEADAAAAIAQSAGVVMVAPLATDESVSDGRSHVFQINPTWTVRGRAMADFAAQRFGTRVAGVVAQLGDSYGERMAEGFQDEAIRLGLTVPFYVLLNSASDWSSMADIVGAARIDSVEVLYLPIASGNAAQLAAAALTSLANAGVDVRVLGNMEWSDLSARDLAARFNTTYTGDFYVMPDDATARAFAARYADLTGNEPRGEFARLAYTGYDVGRFLLARMFDASDGLLADRLLNTPRFQGLGVRIDFAGGNVNRALYYFQHRPGRLDLLR